MGDKFGEEILKRLEEKLENIEKNNILVSKNVEEITRKKKKKKKKKKK